MNGATKCSGLEKPASSVMKMTMLGASLADATQQFATDVLNPLAFFRSHWLTQAQERANSPGL
jgi:hypothetical protein